MESGDETSLCSGRVVRGCALYVALSNIHGLGNNVRACPSTTVLYSAPKSSNVAESQNGISPKMVLHVGRYVGVLNLYGCGII